MSKILYLVEGQCERNLLKSFMGTKTNSFKCGKVEVLNFNNLLISKSYALSLSPDSIVVIVIDTDINSTETLERNLEMLSRHSRVKESNIHIVMSVPTLENEIIDSCDKLKNIDDLFNTSGLKNFKNKFSTCSNLKSKLLERGFKISKIWTSKPRNNFSKFKNKGNIIKNLKNNK